MTELVVILILALVGFFIVLPGMIAFLRGHPSTFAIAATGVIGGVLTPFLLLPFILWLGAFIWSLTSPD